MNKSKQSKGRLIGAYLSMRSILAAISTVIATPVIANSENAQAVGVELGACGEQASAIHSIQGVGSTSPFVGKSVVVEATVTQVVSALSGFFVQSAKSEQDSNNHTSEGIFVYLNGMKTTPAIGERVRLNADVNEFHNRTQLSLTQELLDCGVGEVIGATELTLPVASVADYEALEGMLVKFPQKLSVTDTYNLIRYGQFAISNGRLIKPTNIFKANTPEAAAIADKNARNSIVIDDLSTTQNPEIVPYPSPELSYLTPLRLGDNISQLVGTLDYAFGKFQVYPTTAPQFSVTNTRSKDIIAAAKGEIKVASFNVLNFFNGDGLGGGFPTARGADTVIEFERQKAKIVAALSQINADIVGLMEIENDGFGTESAIAELVNALNKVMGANTYAYVATKESQIGDDAIAVGIIYKAKSVKTIGPAVTTAEAPFDYGNRQPLVQSFTSVENGERFTVAVNHFKSKGSCRRASGENKDQNDGQGCWNKLRTKAAKSLVDWLADYPTGVKDKDILIVGDLNAYGKEDPINVITDSGYSDLLAERIGVSAYSYSYAGELGYLDHALASSSLNKQVTQAMVWHINADEPRAFDYNTEYKSKKNIARYYQPSAFRASDHDPIIVTLKLVSGNK